ncbi:MAG: MarR family transcriptional regulator [Solirubrobacteraceae bacterium]
MTLTSEAEFESAARLRAVVGKLSRRLRPTVAGSELTPSQISVLFTVVRLGPLGLSELAELEAMNPTMLSRITAHLCDAGLLARESRPDDRRAATVSATARGRRLRERVQGERARALSEHVSRLSEDERRLLWAALPALESLAETIGEARR